MVCGSLLDDNQWHDVVIDRESKNISVTVDRLRVTGVSKGPFTVLDIDDSISIGGVKNPNQRGILVQENFRGCIENVIMGKAGSADKAGSAVDLIEGWWSEACENNEFKDELDLNRYVCCICLYRCAKVPGGIQSRERRFLHLRPGESDPSHIPNCRVLHENKSK